MSWIARMDKAQTNPTYLIGPERSTETLPENESINPNPELLVQVRVRVGFAWVTYIGSIQNQPIYCKYFNLNPIQKLEVILNH